MRMESRRVKSEPLTARQMGLSKRAQTSRQSPLSLLAPSNGKVSLEDEGMGPYERGRRRYQQKDYTGALEAFNEAVNNSTQHMLLLALDSRAATFEKLKQLQFALRDARKMILEMPSLSKGYLRCGKVLQLQGENDVALKIYERGLNKVKINADKDRTLLQKMYNKLRDAQGPGTSRDPLEYLPIELAQMICHYLDTASLTRCLAVSPSWRKLLESSHSLWTTFDTTFAKKAISKKSLLIHLRRSNYTLERAAITMRANLDAERLSIITNRCKKLKEFEIHGRGLMGSSLITALPLSRSLESLYISRATEVTINTAQQLIEGCAKSLGSVTILNIRGFPQRKWPKSDSLKSINLRFSGRQLMKIDELRDSMPNATSVTLKDCTITASSIDLTPWEKLEHLDLTNTDLNSVPKLPTGLRHLILNKNTGIELSPDESTSLLPLLETFACANTEFSTEDLKIITAESIKAGNLRNLVLGSRLVGLLNIEAEFPASDTVKELSLSCLFIRDMHMVKVLGLYPHLERLDISNTKVTGVSVRYCVEAGIKFLNLDECQEVGPDAVEWARGKGVEVQFNFPSRAPARGSSFRDAMAGAL